MRLGHHRQFISDAVAAGLTREEAQFLWECFQELLKNLRDLKNGKLK